MTTKKIMLMLMAAMTMVSCNLFIEEDRPEEEED